MIVFISHADADADQCQAKVNIEFEMGLHHIKENTRKEQNMSGQNKFFDDVSQMMTNAMGIAQGAKDEAENAFNSRIERWLAGRNLVTHEEFNAVRDMAIKARTENAELKARLDTLEKALTDIQG